MGRAVMSRFPGVSAPRPESWFGPYGMNNYQLPTRPPLAYYQQQFAPPFNPDAPTSSVLAAAHTHSTAGRLDPVLAVEQWFKFWNKQSDKAGVFVSPSIKFVDYVNLKGRAEHCTLTG